jgi:hypothetical protein
VRRIQDKLARCAVERPESFGAWAHDWVLGPPLAEADVVAVEQRTGLALPPAYRTFLLEVGHGGPGTYGGAGPFYGLAPLASGVELAREVLDVVPGDWWQRESPLRPGVEPHLDPVLGDRDAADDDPALVEATTALLGGLLGLGTHGDTYESALVLTGPSRGRVAYLDTSFLSPPVLTWDADFLAWYERWLDQALSPTGAPVLGLGTPDAAAPGT